MLKKPALLEPALEFGASRRELVLMYGSALFGIIGYFFFPSWLKFLAFFLPIIVLCWVYKSRNDLFNQNLFIILGIIFFLLPCSYITFDASTNYSVDMLNFIMPVVDIFSLLIFVGLPVFLFVCAIIAIIRGNIGGATNAITKLIIIIIFVTLAIYIFNIIGISIPGVTGGVFRLYSIMISIIVQIPLVIIEAINWIIKFLNVFILAITGVMKWFGVETTFDKIPSIELPREIEGAFSSFKGIYSFDIAAERFDNMTHTERVFAVHNSLPLLISILCIAFAIFSSRKKWHARITDVFTKLDYEEKEKERFFFPNMDYTLIIYIVIILIAAFGIYLTYVNAFKKEGALAYEMFKVLGFFSIYLFLSIIPLILLNFSGLAYYKKAKIGDSIKGTLIGLIILFIVFQVMNSGTTMSAMALENHSGEILYILQTFIFVAPSESLMFHVFIPALVMGMIASYSGKKVFQLQGLSVTERLVLKSAEIMAKQETVSIYENLGYKKKVARERAKLNKLNQERTEIVKEITDIVSVYEETIFGRPASVIILIIFGMILPSFVFASFHFFTSGLDDYVLFWTSGLGTIYFTGGCVFIYLNLRYGWLSAVLAHAAWNTWTIILVVFLTVG